jgi:hypothetical protein
MTVLRVDTIAASGQTSENTGSVYFDGTDDVLTILNQSGLAPGTGDYTAEGWFYFDSLPAANVRLLGNVNGNQANSTGWQLIRFNSDTTLKLWDGDSWEDTGVDVSTGEWIHLAVVRQSNTFTLYKNGVAAPNTVSNSNDLTHSGLDIGARDDGSEPINGYISNVRLIIGEALYTSNFSVPTRELDVTSNTVFLGLYDGEDIFADKTGNYIIAAYGDRLSSPTPTATDSPIGITTFQPGLTRGVDVTAGPTLDGDLKFNSQNFFVLPKGTTTDRNQTGGRGVFGWGSNPVDTTIDYVTISSMGNAIAFGDLDSSNRWGSHGCASATRGLFAGGYVNTPASTFYNIIDYITIASTGNPITFGELTEKSYKSACCANSTRGLFAHGYTAPSFGISNVISYVTIASLGDSQNFGDLIVDSASGRASVTALSSSTRGVFAGGLNPIRNTIDFVTISTLGDSQEFGDLTIPRGNASSTSSSTRGVIAGGEDPSTSDVIDFITIASTGDAQDFGNLITATRVQSSSSNNSRAIFGGGYIPSTVVNTINYVTIASTGNAQDFGDLTSGGRRDLGGFSDSHGGL